MAEIITRLRAEAARLGLEAVQYNKTEDFFYAAVKELAGSVHPSKENLLKRHPVKISGTFGVVENEDTLDSHYVRFINDTLKEIRHGRKAYICAYCCIKEEAQ